MYNILDDMSIKPFLEKGLVEPIDSKECYNFNKFISENYPWIPVTQSKIDWNKISSKKRFKWGEDVSLKEVEIFLEKSFISCYNEVCFVFSSSDPGIIIPYNILKKEIETLVCPGFSQGVCFIVGVKRDKYNIPSLVVEDFMEVTLFTDWISYSLDRKR